MKYFVYAIFSGLLGILIHSYIVSDIVVPAVYQELITDCAKMDKEWIWKSREGFLLGYCKADTVDKIVMPPMEIKGNRWRDYL